MPRRHHPEPGKTRRGRRRDDVGKAQPMLMKKLKQKTNAKVEVQEVREVEAKASWEVQVEEVEAMRCPSAERRAFLIKFLIYRKTRA